MPNRSSRRSGVPSRRRAAVGATIAIAAAALGVASASHLQADIGAAPALVPNGFAFLQGTDTLFSDRWERSPTALTGTLTITGQARIQYTIDLTPQETVTRMRLKVFQPTGPMTQPDQEADAQFRGDSLVAIQRADGKADTVRRATPPGTIPYLPPSTALFEQIIRRAKTIGGATPTVSVHLLAQQGGAQTLAARVSYPAADSAVVTFGEVPTSFHIAPDGTILGIPAPDPRVRVVRLTTP